MKKVAIVMGSDSDLPIVKKAAQVLKDFGVPTELRVLSAHRCAAEVFRVCKKCREERHRRYHCRRRQSRSPCRSYSRSDSPAGYRYPDKSKRTRGHQTHFCLTAQTPAGVPVATVAIDGAANAAFLAVQILAVSDDALMEKMKAYLVQHKTGKGS